MKVFAIGDPHLALDTEGKSMDRFGPRWVGHPQKIARACVFGFLGLTMGCAKCHSHKYDPISQHEYYQFYAFFNQTEDADRSDEAPKLQLPTAAQALQLEALRQRIQTAEAQHEQRGEDDPSETWQGP